jgi:hypothetical protein
VTSEDRLIALVRASPTLVRVMEGLREQALPDWRLVSGCVYQTVWNHLTGRDPDHGIKDYDAVYFDPDASWDAEDLWIRQVAAAFPAPLAAMVEVRNQARVHLWFEARFGEPYTALLSTDEALPRFVCPAFAVGIRLENDNAISVAAPFGLDDLFAMRLRPNPNRPINPQGYAKVCASARARWPEVTIQEPAP